MYEFILLTAKEAKIESFRIGNIIAPYVKPELQTEAILAIYRELTQKKGATNER